MFRQYIRLMPPATKHLIAINLAVGLLALLVPRAGSLMVHYGGLHTLASGGFNPAQLLTYFFIPTGLLALLFNALFLFFFGPDTERAVGSKRFLFYYLSCGAGAGLICLAASAIALNHYMDMLPADVSPLDPLLMKIAMLQRFVMTGANSAVYGVVLLYGFIFAEREIRLLFPPVPIKAKYLAMLTVALEIYYATASQGAFWLHFTALGGMLVGLVIAMIWKRSGTFNRYF